MVHALEIAHSLLKKDGLLIDIHPSGRPPKVEVHLDGEVFLAGHVQETDNFVEYFQADEALAKVTGIGLIELEREGQFDFLMHAPTMEDILKYIETEWSDAVLSQEVIRKTKTLLGAPRDGKEVVVREIVRIGRYRAIGRKG